jgi:transposase
MNTIVVGVDLSKSVFSCGEVDASGRVRQSRDLRREGFSERLAQLAASTVVAMEACSGAHHWARRCSVLVL